MKGGGGEDATLYATSDAAFNSIRDKIIELDGTNPGDIGNSFLNGPNNKEWSFTSNLFKDKDKGTSNYKIKLGSPAVHEQKYVDSLVIEYKGSYEGKASGPKNLEIFNPQKFREYIIIRPSSFDESDLDKKKAAEELLNSITLVNDLPHANGT
jgi:hypothetical protein